MKMDITLYLPLQSHYILDTFDVAQLLDKLLKARGIFYVDNKVAAEQPIVAIDVYAAHCYLLFFGYYAGDIVDNANIIVTYNLQRGRVLRRALATPLCPYYTVAEATA